MRRAGLWLDQSGPIAVIMQMLSARMPISALRAFIMAGLLIAALLLDRLALTVRNVALAAMIILALNPAARCTASFQLSFAAMAALVLLYKAGIRQANSESADGRECKPLARPLKYVAALLVTSLINGAATLPFATQHFGMVTIWGLAAGCWRCLMRGTVRKGRKMRQDMSLDVGRLALSVYRAYLKYHAYRTY